MALNEKVQPSGFAPRFYDQAGTVFVLGFLLLACGILLVAPFLALQWQGQPFLGIFTEKGAAIVSAAPIENGAWGLYNQGARFGQVITALDGAAVQKGGELNRLLSQHKAGDVVSLEVVGRDGQAAHYQVTLQNVPLLDLLGYFLLPYIIGLVYLITGVWVFGFRRRDATGKSFAIFASVVAIGVVALFDNYATTRLSYLWTFAVSFLGGALVNMALFFPDEQGSWLKRFPFLRWAAYLPSLVIFLYALPLLFDYQRPLAYADGWGAGYVYAFIGFVFFLARMIYRIRHAETPIVREQSRLILLGALVGFAPIAVYMVFDEVTILLGKYTQVAFSPFLLLFLIFFALMTAYAIARYRLLEADYLATQVILYGTLTFLAAAGYALFVAGLSLLFGGAFPSTNPYVIGIFVFLLAFFLQPLRERLQEIIDATFGRAAIQYRQASQDFGRELTQIEDAQSITRLLHRTIEQTLFPFQLHIFLYDLQTEQYTAAPDENGRPTSDLYFSPTNSLVKLIESKPKALFLGELRTLPAPLEAERARLAMLGDQLYVPLIGRTRLAGWLSLGVRRSGQPYTNREISFLESLANPAALAYERAQVVTDLERRVQAMNVLTRISQGVNVTVALDDILELIYAQTYQVLPTLDFRITLADPYSDTLYHIFYLENDERAREQENQPLQLGQGLEREVLRTRRPLVTDDYERECRNHGVLPTARGLFAWIGVPLNTGKETIGVMTLGSRDSYSVYTGEQTSLLQAIADQAAGAIVKARLLQEAERRARQLTTLNEVARSLSSTLELAPLFNQILKSAVDILNCEAGSLLLVDAPTGELVFEAAVGPVADDFIGTRLPSGTGLVGKAVDSRQAFIVNDVRRTKDWFEKSDEKSGFTTNDLLVVPMVFKDEVTGVIEVINRKDGLPFTPDDQDLLTAFSSQAAVALENARLYTQTDQTLAARVEELSVMQRIDRELNASLDVNRALNLTLDWAMRQSRSTAGLVGMIEANGVQVMAQQGYTQELSAYTNGALPLDFPTIKNSIDTGLPQHVQVNEAEGRVPTLLKDTAEHLVVPIRREDQVVGLLLLESKEHGCYADDNLEFLTRLMDHASIAISNARLYTEVQDANKAKSEFVSFVAHELKNPMTSIRGFADLLAAGIVGPINENQANFLGTIRSNVERMATLVTDLADVSRIEAGRLNLDFAAVQVSAVVDEVVRSMSRQIEEKKQNLTVEMPPDLPMMWGDKMRLIQVITNLISNACKYSPPEGKIFVFAEAADNVWGQGSPRVIHLFVRDTGYGISPENQAKIFQKFYRSDDQKVRDAPGTGLGLNITKQLVELQGGQIWFESEFRVGTTFHIIIPIAEAA